MNIFTFEVKEKKTWLVHLQKMKWFTIIASTCPLLWLLQTCVHLLRYWHTQPVSYLLLGNMLSCVCNNFWIWQRGIPLTEYLRMDCGLCRERPSALDMQLWGPHIHKHTHTFTFRHSYTRTQAHAYIKWHMFRDRYTHTLHIFRRRCIHAHTHIHTHTQACSYFAYTCTHKPIHACIHAYTCCHMYKHKFQGSQRISLSRFVFFFCLASRIQIVQVCVRKSSLVSHTHTSGLLVVLSICVCVYMPAKWFVFCIIVIIVLDFYLMTFSFSFNGFLCDWNISRIQTCLPVVYVHVVLSYG